MTTLSDALAAYRICTKAEGKSPKTVDWVCDTVRYFSEFLGEQANDLFNVNARLKKLVADLSLDNAILKEAAEGNF